MLQVLLVFVAASVSVTWALSLSSNTFVILGGTGRIGTAVATHLLHQQPSAKIILAGRSAERGRQAVQEVLEECNGDAHVEWKHLSDVWDASALFALVELGDCLIHTAGPYLGQSPVPLKVAIASPRCKVYVDVSDPLDYLEASLLLSEEAKASGTSALLAAGAFPGMSNVLAMEAAHHLNSKVKDLFINYFTSGLGGSGDVNLYITNLGFGEPMAQYENGKLRLFQALSGRLLGKVSFYLENGEAKQRIGQQTVFSWPFPEAATVPRELKIVGNSSAAMGTAPDFWNVMLGVLVSLVPRPWWRSEAFSKFLANFSQPLVKATDSLMGGETHGMRIDITGTDGRAVSIVQAHDSFRQCVGQSCAEFALDLMSHVHPGVQLPEQLYRNETARKRIIAKLTTTPGTFLYTGPVGVSEAPAPTLMDQALLDANEAEMKI